ncbi:ABC transporter substrate-binding protein [Marivirga salinae]|uniref:ABC transporter substrate-binding protein n=1 Tax=Marivirga salinarum TaxID=3059078 RepID=A0AA51R807_9BACT|nr:ABC transporter substrate-binding protein [Marivirga sp. BDSF4-3]WMN10682.1 ABC transporter substrate-binding protein [Marivirga sp. BDSF4-3]
MRFRPIVIFGVILILSVFQLNAQTNYQSDYLSGKNYFKAGEYQRAQNHFQKLLDINESNPFYLYASYYYALSAYETGDVESAMEILRGIRSTHPDWDKIAEVEVWYGKMLLEEGDLFKGIEVLNAIEAKDVKPIAEDLEKSLLLSYDSIPLLQKAIELNPYDKILAQHLANKISRQPLVERKVELMEFLIDSFDLNRSGFDFVDESVSQMKDTYRVGVMLPFMADGLSTSKGNKGNQFILDIYQGISEAVAELNKEKEQIQLFAYDTQQDSAATAELLESGDLEQMDLIIGPLYPDPAQLVREYSAKNRINMVNPLSTNSVTIGTNPYSFLMKSTSETRAKIAANYAKQNFKNKNATIFYGDKEQDSVFAYNYKEYLEADSFNITWMAAARDPLASTEILRTLTEVFDTDTLKNQNKVYISNTVKVRVGEEDSLILSRDTIGHVMVASSDNLLVSNVLSALDTRRDSIPVIGFDDWLEMNQISFDQLQRMKVIMVGQNYFDFSSPEVAEFKEDYRKTYNKLPSHFSYDGYETMRYFGEKLIEYGNYYQYGIYKEGFQPGYLYFGFDYTNANDNQVVPITTMESLELKMLNYEEVDEMPSDFKE